MSARAVLRLGTRGSALARAQSEAVRAALALRWPEVDFRLEILKTRGDAWGARPDDDRTPAPDKGFFTREFEEALRAGTIDLAVHSLKDLPTGGAAGLTIAAVPARADARDVLIAKAPGGAAALPPAATVATGSRRRAAQLRLLRPGLATVPVRGNVDTRLRKLRENAAWHGMVLAAAGLERLHGSAIVLPGQLTGVAGGQWLYDGALGLAPTSDAAVEAAFDGLFLTPLSYGEMLPAPAQGALALQVRADDAATLAWAAALDDAPTRAAVIAERAFLAGLGGGCQAPVGAHAALEGGRLDLRGVAWLDGDAPDRPRRGEVSGPADRAEELGRALARELREQAR